jgi:hypothetical protein
MLAAILKLESDALPPGKLFDINASSSFLELAYARPSPSPGCCGNAHRTVVFGKLAALGLKVKK